MRENHTQLHTLVLRLWRERTHSDVDRWQGTMLHPATGEEIHFIGEEGLTEKLVLVLRDLGSENVKTKGELR